MDVPGSLLPYLLAWVPMLAFLVWFVNKQGQTGSGLVLAYGFQFWMLYWVGAALHAMPSSALPDGELVLHGFEVATVGLASFAAGVMLLAKRVAGYFEPKEAVQLTEPDRKLPLMYLGVGLVSFTVLAPLGSVIPSFAALTSVGTQLFVVGLCLGCWSAWARGDRVGLIRWLASCTILPVTTVLTMGFLGFGAIALSLVLIFVGQFFRPRWVLGAAFLAVSFFGVSLYVNYFMSRDMLRSSVWGGASYSERIDTVLEIVDTAQWFDPGNPAHLEAIDGRINQNGLVGAAVQHLSTTNEYAYGETLWMGVIAMVPRILWPDKPVSAGSGGLVTQFTGLEFAEGTSVGIGPVLELYANFGMASVVIGFMVLGGIIGGVDLVAGSRLRDGRWEDFSLWFLFGMAFLNVGGSFVEVGSGAAASLILGNAGRFVLKRYRKKSAAPAPEAALEPGSLTV